MGRNKDTRWEQFIIRSVILKHWNYSRVHYEIVRAAINSDQSPLSLSTVRRRVMAVEKNREGLTQHLNGTLPIDREQALLAEVRNAMYGGG